MATRKLGNAFSDPTHRLNMSSSKEDTANDSDTTTLKAPDDHAEDASPAPRNSFDQLVGPTTETERRGRSLVREQHHKMVASLKSQSPTKQPRKRSNTETSKSSKLIKSERKPGLPVPQLFDKIKNKMASKRSKANLKGPDVSAADINKPLPTINVSATVYPTDPAYSDIPNFLTMPSPSPRWERSPEASHDSPAQPMNPEARSFVPESPAQFDWPLPSSSPVPPPQIVPQVPSVTTAAAPVATLPSGIVFANQGPQFLTPARTGTYTSVQKPVIVAAGPTHASMQASIVDTAPATPVTPAAISEEDDDEEGDDAKAPTGITLAELRQELFRLYTAIDARLGRIEGRLARVEGAVGRVEALAREDRAQAKHEASFGGRYPGDAKDMLAFK